MDKFNNPIFVENPQIEYPEKDLSGLKSECSKDNNIKDFNNLIDDLGPHSKDYPALNDVELVQQKLDRSNLKNAVTEAKQNIKFLTDQLDQSKKLNHKLSQDLEYSNIQISNLYNINTQLDLALKNLQSNKTYISKLLHKKIGANSRIIKLIQTVKRLQAIIKQKNLIINKSSYNNNKLLEQASRIIKESYSI